MVSDYNTIPLKIVPIHTLINCKAYFAELSVHNIAFISFNQFALLN